MKEWEVEKYEFFKILKSQDSVIVPEYLYLASGKRLKERQYIEIPYSEKYVQIERLPFKIVDGHDINNLLHIHEIDKGDGKYFLIIDRGNKRVLLVKESEYIFLDIFNTLFQETKNEVIELAKKKKYRSIIIAVKEDDTTNEYILYFNLMTGLRDDTEVEVDSTKVKVRFFDDFALIHYKDFNNLFIQYAKTQFESVDNEEKSN